MLLKTFYGSALKSDVIISSDRAAHAMGVVPLLYFLCFGSACIFGSKRTKHEARKSMGLVLFSLCQYYYSTTVPRRHWQPYTLVRVVIGFTKHIPYFPVFIFQLVELML